MRHRRVGTGFAYIARRPRTAEKKLAFMKVRRRCGTNPCSVRLTFISLLQFDPKGAWASPREHSFAGKQLTFCLSPIQLAATSSSPRQNLRVARKRAWCTRLGRVAIRGSGALAANRSSVFCIIRRISHQLDLWTLSRRGESAAGSYTIGPRLGSKPVSRAALHAKSPSPTVQPLSLSLTD